MDRTLGLGYIKSSIFLFLGVIAVLVVWKLVVGKIQFNHVSGKKNEAFYWFTILVSNTLGTALGDFTATTIGLGFEKGALVFILLLAVVAALYYFTNIPASVLFWSAYVLTRPLGATLGDTLTKPVSDGGFSFSRIASTAIIGLVIVAGIIIAQPKYFRLRGQEEEDKD